MWALNTRSTFFISQHAARHMRTRGHGEIVNVASQAGLRPGFAHRAADLGVLSMLSFQLYVQDEEMGSLNLYSRTASGFDNDDENVGLLFSSHAAVALVGAQHENNLLAALAGRDTIGQAKGILMERYQITESVAFSVLVRTSQTSNRKLRDIAETLAQTGVLEMTTPLNR